MAMVLAQVVLFVLLFFSSSSSARSTPPNLLKYEDSNKTEGINGMPISSFEGLQKINLSQVKGLDEKVLQSQQELDFYEGNNSSSFLDNSTSILDYELPLHVLAQVCPFGYYCTYDPYGWGWNLYSFMVTLVLVSILVLVVACWCYLCVLGDRRKVKLPKICEGNLPNRVTFHEVLMATSGFANSRIIIQSRSVVVYHGYLRGRVVVKRFSGHQMFSREFDPWNRKVRHPNIIPIRGWCIVDETDFILIYQLMPHTLHELLEHGNNSIPHFHTFEARIAVIEGIGSALQYLHEGCETPIVHNNIRSCTIYVDSYLVPKLAHLGYSSSVGPNALPTVLTDVFSFGIVILEVASGREHDHHHDDDKQFIEKIWNLWGKGQLLEASDSRLPRNYQTREMEKLLKIGLWCVHPFLEQRPSVSSALRMISGKVNTPDPPLMPPMVQTEADVQLGVQTDHP